MKKLIMVVLSIFLVLLSAERVTYGNLLRTIPDDIRYFGELVRCTEAEATDGTFEQKMNVASCIINRRDSKNWPSTIHDVIFQKGQFSVISDRRYYTVKIRKSTIEACWEVITHGKTHKCYFFCTPKAGRESKYFKNKEVIFEDGMHNYYY